MEVIGHDDSNTERSSDENSKDTSDCGIRIIWTFKAINFGTFLNIKLISSNFKTSIYNSPETLLTVVFVSFSLLLFNCLMANLAPEVVGVDDVVTSSSVVFDVASHFPTAVTS